jgi:hypothetical protein
MESKDLLKKIIKDQEQLLKQISKYKPVASQKI